MNTQEIALESIAASPTNPRRRLDQGALDELVESIRTHGVLQPILVRPWTPPDKGTPADALGVGVKGKLQARGKTPPAFEVVCGERRRQAAKRAGLKTIPAVCQAYTDGQAQEIQLVENLQRADLHPLEEADGYAALVARHQVNPEDLAARIGKSRSYVYGRLKLATLCQAGRKALWEGTLPHSHALLVARLIDEKRQEEALESISHGDGEVVSYREAADIIHAEFMLRLKDAPFDVKDESLPGGPCADCPKRTGNQPDLFADVQAKDTCTDPDCYQAKRDAWTGRQLEKARAKGETVIPKDESDKVFTKYGTLKSDWVPANEHCEALEWENKKTWAQVLGKKSPPAVLAVSPEGELKRVLPRAQAFETLEEVGVKVAPRNDWDAQTDRRAKNKKKFTALAMAAAPKILDAVLSGTNLKEECWPLLARAVYQVSGHDALTFVAKRRGLATSAAQTNKALDAWFKTEPDPAALAGFVVETLLIARWNSDSWEFKPGKAFKDLCALAGVSLKELGKERDDE